MPSSSTLIIIRNHAHSHVARWLLRGLRANPQHHDHLPVLPMAAQSMTKKQEEMALRNAAIIRMAADGKRHQEIAEAFGLNRERIRQILRAERRKGVEVRIGADEIRGWIDPVENTLDISVSSTITLTIWSDGEPIKDMTREERNEFVTRTLRVVLDTY